MPDFVVSEIYFVFGMMILIVVICIVAFYAFFKTYYKEKAIREKGRVEKNKQGRSTKE